MKCFRRSNISNVIGFAYEISTDQGVIRRSEAGITNCASSTYNVGGTSAELVLLMFKKHGFYYTKSQASSCHANICWSM